MTSYTFRSGLPPAAARRQLERVVADWNLREQGGARTTIIWRGDWVMLKRTEYERREQTGIRRTRGSVSWGIGASHGWTFANPFHGRLLPDGQGGSILEGRIVLHRGAAWMIFCFAAVIVAVFSFSAKGVEEWLVFACGTALLLYHAVPAFGLPERNPASQRLLARLEEVTQG